MWTGQKIHENICLQAKEQSSLKKQTGILDLSFASSVLLEEATVQGEPCRNIPRLEQLPVQRCLQWERRTGGDVAPGDSCGAQPERWVMLEQCYSLWETHAGSVQDEWSDHGGWAEMKYTDLSSNSSFPVPGQGEEMEEGK